MGRILALGADQCPDRPLPARNSRRRAVKGYLEVA